MVRLSNGHIHCAFVDRTHLAVCDDPTTLQQQLSRVFSISTSPLPATWNLYTYVYPHHSLPIASPMAPHGRVCSLIRNTPQATAPQFLGAAFFHFQNAPEQGRKSPPPPKSYVFDFLFLPLSRWLRCQLHPMKVLFARCYPITSSCTPSLWPGLP